MEKNVNLQISTDKNIITLKLKTYPVNKLHREEATLALIDAGIKLLKGRAPVRHVFLTKEQAVT